MRDPHFEQEALKYENPIPSREFILSFIADKKQSFRQLAELLEITPEQSKPLKNRLKAMVRDKQLSVSKNGVYRLFSNHGLLTGEVIANPKGFGFVKLDKGGKDLRLSYEQMQLCFHGDKVRVRLLNNKGDAEIVQVLTKQQNLVARLIQEGGEILAIIDDKNIKHRVHIPQQGKYQESDVVLLNIVQNPTVQSLAVGEITSKIGEFGDRDLESISALIRLNIPYVFPEEVLQEANVFSESVEVTNEKNRVDLTHLDFVTIDGEDSRDFDDAVYAEQSGQGYTLYVAIADVAHYVAEGSALDKEAQERGNSVYLPRFVVPMLPEKLSNGLCSINEQVLRLALVCTMHISSLGEVTDFRFDNAYIKSRKRLTYDAVNAFLSGEAVFTDKAIINNIQLLKEVYKLLKMNRAKLGLIEFNRKETKMSFDEMGKITAITPYKRGVSHKIIEECMLIANKTAGDFLTAKHASFLYRSHPAPGVEKLLATRKFLANLGLELGGEETPTAKDFAKVLSAAKGRADENIIKMLILRTMSQAVYSADHPHHFGLAFENYTHFTSPIRRYADLIAHRAIKAIINKESRQHIKNIEDIAHHISMTERRADEASRDSERWLKCEYMLAKVGQEFSGVISGVTSFGFFVELDEVFVDGLVAIRELDDYFIYDESTLSLTGKRKRTVYKLGDSVSVIVASVNLEAREINLVPYD